MLVYLAAFAAATATDHINGPTAGGILVTTFGAVLGALVVAAHRRDTSELAHDEPAGIDAMLQPADITDLIPVAHEGATEGWSPAADVTVDAHPLDTSVPLTFGDDLVPAHFFNELRAFNPVDFDYPASSFTQEWVLAGTRLAEMGDTQVMQAVDA